MKSPEIIIIAALAEANNVIGKNGKLPWRIPEDSERFQQLTRGHAVIMGRKTWECDLQRQPLANRYNIIVSSSLPPGNIAAEPPCPYALSFVTSLEEGLKTGE